MSDAVAEFIAHYGVKGMKWGVRRKSGPRPDFMPPVKSSPGKPKWQSPPAKKTAAAAAAPAAKRGGFGKKKPSKPMSEEAREFSAIRMKAKKEGLQSLSNKELEVLNKRLELQSKYNKAFPKQKSFKAKAAGLAIEAVLSDFGSKAISDFVGGPQPRNLIKAKRAANIATMVTTANMARKIIRPG